MPDQSPKEKSPAKSGSAKKFQAPTGTRDMYPDDLLRARYIEKLWRDTSIRHGFEEIDGPTFEHLDLYTVKSGEGIVSELFSFRRSGGEKDYALRPEFTPTLARMYAARANALPKPCKWFWMQNCFRAERPQRGRLREFRQWNCDVTGSQVGEQNTAGIDAELVMCVVDALRMSGLTPREAKIRYSHRQLANAMLAGCGLVEEVHDRWLPWIDGLAKMSVDDARQSALKFTTSLVDIYKVIYVFSVSDSTKQELALNELNRLGAGTNSKEFEEFENRFKDATEVLEYTEKCLRAIDSWCERDSSVVRGLAYYTGMVFEVIAEGERAVAGGGRYDNLIELFGGPPTPAVGFGMGDVVLSLLLEDKGLMPTGRDLVEALSQPGASLRPDVFVVSNGDDDAESQVVPVVAKLRSGIESEAWRDRNDRKPWDDGRYEVRPLHARQTYKTTRNVGKLMKDAVSQHARWIAVIESAETCMLKNLDTNEQHDNVPIDTIGKRVQG
ncbi:MAG: ATP phosphoribosyltransferase regulatory subunit [Phycisphaeraceae bacterium]|nr:ATP phosphoribosyltransferase regulatory subunit [Phycisphaerales bacterium]MCB9860258.1 ATP phosphoribosyltransferase regulatory subunit [Phycisphaeraceae bacterium]